MIFFGAKSKEENMYKGLLSTPEKSRGRADRCALDTPQEMSCICAFSSEYSPGELDKSISVTCQSSSECESVFLTGGQLCVQEE
jgi:hypothetical protein